ncbi:MAG: MJ0042-type zinc finger domain-containing protein, partial [Rhodopila sp.]
FVVFANRKLGLKQRNVRCGHCPASWPAPRAGHAARPGACLPTIHDFAAISIASRGWPG